MAPLSRDTDGFFIPLRLVRQGAEEELTHSAKYYFCEAEIEAMVVLCRGYISSGIVIGDDWLMAAD